MAQLLQNLEYTEAQDHLLLWAAISKEKGWTIPEEMINKISQNPLPDARQLQGRLRNFWKQLIEEALPTYEGYISGINEGALSGFIADGKGNSYYFSRKDWKGDDAELRKGIRVRFRLTTRVHPKTQKPVQNAVMVEPIDKH